MMLKAACLLSRQTFGAVSHGSKHALSARHSFQHHGEPVQGLEVKRLTRMYRVLFLLTL